MIPQKERERMISLEDTNLSISKQCALLAVNRSNLYYRPVCVDSEDLEILKLIGKLYFSCPFYGYRKVTAWVNSKGYLANEKRIRRLMKIVNWQTIYREPRTTIVNKEHKKYPYLLKNLSITHKNQVWATDITYIPMEKGFMYLCAILDLKTRFVLNWSINNTMTAEWCAEVLQETIDKYGVPEIFNTDQGCQYTSEIHTKILIDNNIKISMDGRGRAIDNIFVERLWRTVKYENIYLKAYSDGLELYLGLKEYFDFYNNERFHQSLDYKNPRELYENKAVA
jgi:putative transposase